MKAIRLHARGGPESLRFEDEHRDPSTDNCEGGIAREAAGENSTDDFVAKLIASGVPIITSDEMWEDLGVEEYVGRSTARLDTSSTGLAPRAGTERLAPSRIVPG